MIVSVIMLVLVLLFGNEMSMLFINKGETEALGYAFRYTLLYTIGFPLLTLVLTVRFTIQGMGFSAFAMTAGVLEMVARCFVAIVLPIYFGFTSVCLANVCAWLAADLFLVPAFFFCRRKLEKKLGDRQPNGQEEQIGYKKGYKKTHLRLRSSAE